MKVLKDLSQLRNILIKDGSVFLMHQSILRFGNTNDWHYSFCHSEINEFKSSAKFNPSTSHRKSNNNKVFRIRFKDDTDIKDTGRDTYILLSLIRDIPVSGCINDKVSRFKGNLNSKALHNYKKAVKAYIRSQYKKA